MKYSLQHTGRSGHIYLFVLSIIFLAFMGCDDATLDAPCPSMSYPAVVIEVQDGVTGQYIAKDAKGLITDGAYQDSLKHFDITQREPTLIVRTLAAGLGRGGTYDIEIKHEGYQIWTRRNVEVPEGPCNPETQFLEARLKPVQNK